MRSNYTVPPLRPELQVASEEMDATEQFFAFAVSQTWDDKAWEVNTKEGCIYSALDGCFSSQEQAQAAGQEWLKGMEGGKAAL